MSQCDSIINLESTVMSNLLALAFKKSYPADVKEAARSFLQHKSNIHPDAFKADINRWQILRKDGVGGSVHVDRIDSILRFCPAHLLFFASNISPCQVTTRNSQRS